MSNRLIAALIMALVFIGVCVAFYMEAAALRVVVERLTAENRQLRASMDAAATAAAAVDGGRGPGAPPTISGAVWFVRGVGSSSLLRGQRVSLIRPSVPRATVVDSIRHSLQQRIKDAEAEARRKRDAVGGDGVLPGTGLDELRRLREQLEQLEVSAKKLPDALDAPAAYDFAKVASPQARDFLPAVDAMRVGAAKTDVDGRFELRASPGSYYLHARFDSPSTYIEWLVPVDVRSADVEINLENENAAAAETSSTIRSADA